MAEVDTSCILDLLPTYYSRLFPVRLLHRWLSYGNDDSTFACREFSFVLPGDVYVRYQSFGSEDEFAKALQKKRPEKIDIGAVYTSKPKLRGISGDFQPIQKEFVLDIDLTDYDEIRVCCDGAKVCQKCWKFMVVAVEILDKALRDDFGFKHLLWVFSGRRGVHCWVADETARFLDVSGRSAVIEYLNVVKGGENQAKKVKLSEHIHPSLERALKIIDPCFETICIKEQGIFEKGREKYFDVLPDDLKIKLKRENGSRERWNMIQTWVNEKKSDKNISMWKKPKIVEEIKLQFCYPRLDFNVSIGLNHLLKSPFCVHPKTGKICVPFNPDKVHDFDVSNVPTLGTVMNEINAHDAEHKSSAGISDWKKTSLVPYMEVFIAFVKGLEKEAFHVKTERVDESKMEF